MQVKIIKSSHWHTGKIGQIFTVKKGGFQDGYVVVDDPRSKYHQNGSYFEDYEIVPESKFVTYEDVRYEVPSWANHLTRDEIGTDVFAWEFEPKWTEDKGWYHSRIGKSDIIKPYVKPKPEGNFKISI